MHRRWCEAGQTYAIGGSSTRGLRHVSRRCRSTRPPRSVRVDGPPVRLQKESTQAPIATRPGSQYTPKTASSSYHACAFIVAGRVQFGEGGVPDICSFWRISPATDDPNRPHPGSSSGSCCSRCAVPSRTFPLLLCGPRVVFLSLLFGCPTSKGGLLHIHAWP